MSHSVTTGQDAILDLDAVRNWFSRLYGKTDRFELINVVHTGDWAGETNSLTYLDPLIVGSVERADMSEPLGVYHRVTTLKRRPSAGQRGSAGMSSTLPALWADIDIAGPGHATTEPLPADEDAARLIVSNSVLPEPTLWVHSGGGLYPYWILDTPAEITTENFAEIKQLSEDWHEELARSAKELGMHYGTGIGDLARVLRIPGTVNRKAGIARPCRVIQDDGPTYTIEKLREIAPRVAPLAREGYLSKLNRDGSTTDDIDTWASSVSWADILTDDGWMEAGTDSDCGCPIYTAPGIHESPKSATAHDVGCGKYDTTQGHGPIHIWTADPPAGLKGGSTISKLSYIAATDFGGNTSEAMKALQLKPIRKTPELAPLELGYSTPDDETVRTESASLGGEVQPRAWNDFGNAHRLNDQHGNVFRWVPQRGQFAAYLFREGRWDLDSDAWAPMLMRRVLESLAELEADYYDDEPGSARNDRKPDQSMREAFIAWAATQQYASKIKAGLEVAKTLPERQAKLTDFDRDPWKLNTRNGVLNLRTGELEPHGPEQMNMFRALPEYDPNATAEMWDAFLERVMPDPEMRGYLQRVAGYSLTGRTDEQVMFLHYGSGANGKSVFLDVMDSVLGDYAQVVPRNTLLTKSGDAVPNDVARMVNRRFLQTTETAAGRRLDEEMVKSLTGGDKVSARFMRAEFFDFHPIGKIHLATNHLPRVSQAESIWRRLHLVTWGVVIPENERNGELARKIVETEASGVLAWAVRGCFEWQSRGLDMPSSMREHIAKYRKSEDILGQFIEDCTEEAPGEFITTDQLYRAFKAWWESSGESDVWKKIALSKGLVDKGYRDGRETVNGKRARGFYGLRLTSTDPLGQ